MKSRTKFLYVAFSLESFDFLLLNLELLWNIGTFLAMTGFSCWENVN